MQHLRPAVHSRNCNYPLSELHRCKGPACTGCSTPRAGVPRAQARGGRCMWACSRRGCLMRTRSPGVHELARQGCVRATPREFTPVSMEAVGCNSAQADSEDTYCAPRSPPRASLQGQSGGARHCRSRRALTEPGGRTSRTTALQHQACPARQRPRTWYRSASGSSAGRTCPRAAAQCPCSRARARAALL